MPHLISIDYRSMVFVDGEPLNQHLTLKEATVLRAVLQHDRVATRDFLLNLIYAGQDEPEMKILDVFVAKLRAKLGPHRIAVQTVWGRGFCRHPDYALAIEEGSVAVAINAKLLDDIVAAGGGDPEELIARLLKAEHERLWSAEAA